jgi:hypothetical protein
VELPFPGDLSPGTYYLVAIADSPDSNPEPDESNNRASCQISILNSIDLISRKVPFSVFPVPADDHITLLFEQGGPGVERLQITDILGQVVYTEITENDWPTSRTIDVSDWMNGYYLVSVYTGAALFHKLIVIR